MKKNNIIWIVFLSVAFLSSCKKYLNVLPQTQVAQNTLFNTQSGFQAALTGAYIQMTSVNSYGQALSYTSIEQLISNWDVANNSVQQKIGQFNYTDASVMSTMSGIFAQQYTIISSVNAILAQIDQNKSVFTTPGMYQMIKGECLAIRAYCHLDVLRLWGPIPSNVSTAGLVLPYVKVLSTVPNAYSTYAQYQSLLMQDLTSADSLLKGVDPVLSYSLSDLGNPGIQSGYIPGDNYQPFRFFRLNYYAVKALEARAYLWFNDPTNAYNAAMTVINATNPDGTNKFRLGNAADMTAGDLALTKEQIFGLYVYNLNAFYNNNFYNGSLKRGSSNVLVNTNLYGNTGTDIREVNLWFLQTQTDKSLTYIMLKYFGTANPGLAATDYNRIPMLRLSEMYLTAIETTPSATEAQNLWAAFRTARNITVTTLPSGTAAIQSAILPEYRKEFFGEGQGFFAYKRLNTPSASIFWIPTGYTMNYIIPLPLTEVVH